MFINTHLTQSVAREAIEYRVRDAESRRSHRDPARPPRTRVRRPLSVVRRAAHPLA